MVANVNFREQIRRTWSSKPASPRPRSMMNGDAEENNPLLPGGVPDGGGRHETRASFVRRLLLDPKATPGSESPNPLVRYPAYFANVLKYTLFRSYLNILLVFVPIGIVAGQGGWNATAIFALNFFAIIPLAAVLSDATEDIAWKLGDIWGGLLNASFGNAVELIVSILALRSGQIQVVQSSMLGSILSNLLLVMGMCFFLGGVVNMRDPHTGEGIEQSFRSATAQTTCSLMALSSASMILPATLYGVLDRANDEHKRESILLLSRCTAIVLLFLYVMFMFFQLWTHKNLFDGKAAAAAAAAARSIHPSRSLVSEESNATTLLENGLENGVAGEHHHHPEGEEDKDEEDGPGIGTGASVAVLVVVTIIISFCADYMVGSIDSVVESGKISRTFIGLILIPIVGNAAEHVSSCMVAVKNNMDLAVGIAVGSSIQIALLVTPIMVILGWIIGQPMSLHFETFETIAFALSVLIVTYTVQDGKSNYLEGAMLTGLYIIIAVAFWTSPSDALDHTFGF